MIPSVRHIQGPAGRRMLVYSLLLATVLAITGTRPVDPASGETDPSVHVGALATPAERAGDGAQATSTAAATDGAQTTAAADAAGIVKSAGSDRFSWAARDLNVQVLPERASERKPISDRSFDSSATRPIPCHPPAHSIARAASHGDAAPPRLLFYLHGALLI